LDSSERFRYESKITIEEIRKYMDIETPEFPKYVAPLINLANQYAQGTRPKVVGQMSELIQEFEGKTLQESEEWYLKKKTISEILSLSCQNRTKRKIILSYRETQTIVKCSRRIIRGMNCSF
jgi:hypothetical protein